MVYTPRIGIPCSGLKTENCMAGLSMAQRLPLLAIIRGLREGGEIGERSLTAIAGELRSACAISDRIGDSATSDALRHLARCIETGRVE